MPAELAIMMRVEEHGLMMRQFRPEDASVCSSIVLACLLADTSVSRDLRNRLAQNISAESMRESSRMHYMAVCESESGIVGLCGLEMNEIRFLCVAPEHQRHGVGRKMLSHLESMIPPALFADVFVYSSPAAVGFYRAHGFQPRGQHTFQIERILLPTIFLTKPAMGVTDR
jgi:N-acetylglutamate synthase-like GNAT family acetyltransferase